MSSKWVKAATKKSQDSGGKGSFRKIAGRMGASSNEPEQKPQKKKKGIVEAMNDPQAY